MAITITTPGAGAPQMDSLGKFNMVVADVDVTSYTTSGETIAAGDFNMTTIVGIIATPTEFAYVGRFNSAYTLFLIFGEGTNSADVVALTEESATADGGTWRFMVFGY